MRPELYRRIPMVIQMARKLSTFFVIVIVNFIVGHTIYNTTLQLVLLIYWYRLVWAMAKTVATS